MSTRLSSILWIIALFTGAMLAGGAVAGHLQNLEATTLRAWQEKLTTAGQKKANETATYLEAQQQILQEINNSPAISQSLRLLSGTTRDTAPDITTTLDDIANLKYGLNHTYIFGRDSQLLARQPEARDLPLKVREALDRAYQTGLKSYMFFAGFENKTWFIASRRISDGPESLGYSAFMLEASAAMDPLRNSVFRWQELDFNLARRSEEENVFIVSWTGERPDTKKYAIAETNLPLFSGTADTFQSVSLRGGVKRLMHIASVPTFPFWQHMTSIPTETAMAEVRTTRMFYLFGLGVFLLFVFALMLGFLRRVIDPSLPILPETLTGRKNTYDREKANKTSSRKGIAQQTKASQNHTEPQEASVNTSQPKPDNETSRFGKVKTAISEKVPAKKVLARPSRLITGLLGAMPWASRKLSEEEKERMQQKSAPPEETPDSAPATPPEPEKFTSGTERTQPEVVEPTPEELAEQQRLEQEKAEQQKVKQIHNCLENEKYRLHFQPILETKSKEKVMFETLLRLVDEKGELMQPGDFFPLAIKHGFVDQVDDMVIVASLRRHMEILTQGKKHMLSINLSYGAFNSMNFMNTFKEGLKSGKLKPELLNFELNSKEIIEDESAMRFVREMQKSGAKFSVDFFGDPGKTVQAAKKLKFDYMKVDCLKFDGLANGDAKQVERFKNVVTASKEQNLPLIAEKIEGKSVMWLCEKLGVEYVQGFYLAEPSPKLSLGW